MNILSIDTSSKIFSLAVSRNEKILACRSIALKDVLSSAIVPALKKILREARVSLPQLDGFAIGLGPGSFTSLRVGLSTVKAFAFATCKPVVGIPSLDVIAMNAVIDNNEDICVMTDAKRNLIYNCLYEKNGALLRRKTDYLLTGIDELFRKIKRKTLLIGDGIRIFQAEILKRKDTSFPAVTLAGEQDWHPSAANLAILAYRRFKEKKFDCADTLVPLYLYPEDCQVHVKCRPYA